MNKDINFADIKNSPYLIVAVLALFVIGAVALCVYVTNDIMATKEQIIGVRAEYEANCDKIAYLQSLQSQGDQLIAEKEMFEQYFPGTKDSYEMVEEVYGVCDSFKLKITAFDTPAVTVGAVLETSLSLTVKGTYESIIGFAEYYANQTAIHRVERLIIKNDSSSDLKIAELLITAISNPAAVAAPAAE